MTVSARIPEPERERTGQTVDPSVPGEPRAVPHEPPPELRFRRALKLGTALEQLWRSRHVVWSLAVRQLRSTYNQEILGVAWALLTPFTLMVVFTFIFERVGNVNTGGVPYPLFSYVGLLPWTFFQSALSTGGLSLVNQPLLNKVYAPREVFPLSEVVVGAIGAACATIALAFLFMFEGRAPSATSYWIVPLIPILVAFVVACTLLASSVTVYFRDLRHALPLILQVGMFVTPVVYGLDEMPRSFRGAYVALNPLAGVIDGFRRAVLTGRTPRMSYTAVAAVSAFVYLLGTYLLFKRLETGFADLS